MHTFAQLGVSCYQAAMYGEYGNTVKFKAYPTSKLSLLKKAEIDKSLAASIDYGSRTIQVLQRNINFHWVRSTELGHAIFYWSAKH